MPDVALTTDLIVGFPGETEEQFGHSMSLLAELRFDCRARGGLFAATGNPGRRPDRRCPRGGKASPAAGGGVAAGRDRGPDQRTDWWALTVEILVEGQHKGKWMGRTRSDKIVFFTDEGDWRGRLAMVTVTWAGPWSLQAEFA